MTNSRLSLGCDKLGRERYEIDGVRYTVEKKMPLEGWIKKTFGSYMSFLDLKPPERRKLFLRWKWGFLNNDSNEELESTENYMLMITKDVPFDNAGMKEHFDRMRNFNAYCYELKKQIGLE